MTQFLGGLYGAKVGGNLVSPVFWKHNRNQKCGGGVSILKPTKLWFGTLIQSEDIAKICFSP